VSTESGKIKTTSTFRGTVYWATKVEANRVFRRTPNPKENKEQEVRTDYGS